jgi:hypothetical protein
LKTKSEKDHREKRNKKEVAEGALEQSTVRTKREKITQRNRQLHNEILDGVIMKSS